MKKQFFLIYIFLCFGVIYSLNIDYGASIDSYIGINLSSSTYAYGFEKVSLYGSSQFTENISLSIDGYYKYLIDGSEGGSNEHVLSFETLVLSLPLGALSIDVGRDLMTDYSGNILSHTLDGLAINIPLKASTLQAKAGFSGLINVNENGLFTTSSDTDSVSRIIEGVDLVKEYEATTLYSSLYAIQDMEELTNNFSIYVGGGIDGSFGTSVYYNVSGNLQTGLFPYTYETTVTSSTGIIAGAGSISINWFIQSDSEMIKSLSPYLSVNAGVSSGDSNLTYTSLGQDQEIDISEGISLYTPMVTGGPGVIHSLNNQNLTYFKVDASAVPIKNLQTKLGTTLFFRTVQGPVSDTDVDAAKEGNYLGSEVSLTGNYRIFSDLGVTLTTGLYIPNSGILIEEADGGVTGIIAGYVSLSL